MSLWTTVKSWFKKEESAYLAPLIPVMEGIYRTVKNDAEAALRKAEYDAVLALGSAATAAEGAALTDWNNLVASIKGYIVAAQKDTKSSGVQKFETVAKQVVSLVASGVFKSIPVIGTAALNALINSIYTSVLVAL